MLSGETAPTSTQAALGLSPVNLSVFAGFWVLPYHQVIQLTNTTLPSSQSYCVCMCVCCVLRVHECVHTVLRCAVCIVLCHGVCGWVCSVCVRVHCVVMLCVCALCCHAVCVCVCVHCAVMPCVCTHTVLCCAVCVCVLHNSYV